MVENLVKSLQYGHRTFVRGQNYITVLAKMSHTNLMLMAYNFWLTVLSVEPLVQCVVCHLSVCNVLYCGETVPSSNKKA